MPNKFGEPPLNYVLLSNMYDDIYSVVKLLMKAGADINKYSSDQTGEILPPLYLVQTSNH